MYNIRRRVPVLTKINDIMFKSYSQNYDHSYLKLNSKYCGLSLVVLINQVFESNGQNILLRYNFFCCFNFFLLIIIIFLVLDRFGPYINITGSYSTLIFFIVFCSWFLWEEQCMILCKLYFRMLFLYTFTCFCQILNQLLYQNLCMLY